MRAIALILVLMLMCAVARGEPTLWYAQPAEKWTDALPIGSGRMGAMVFGGVAVERLQFNEDTLWTGKPRDYVRAGAHEQLAKIQGLVFAGKTKEAEDLARKTFLSDPVRQKAYQPFGDLYFKFPFREEASGYRRELDLDTAIATTSFKIGAVTYRREVLASYPDRAIVVHLSADKPGSISFSCRLTSPHKTATTRPVNADTLATSGQVLDPTVKDEPGLKFESRLRVVPAGGKISTHRDTIDIDHADAVTLLLVANTSFVNFQDISADPAKRCEDDLARLSDKTFEAIREAHVADHQKLFRRMTIALGEDKSIDPTDQRLKKVRAGGLDADPSLAALFFQYGRYLLIASSRPGSQPANLQGVWNELLNPPWESKYTTNINLEMNYWPAEVANLSDCAGPLFDLVDDLRVSGARTAKKQYGARGWVLNHNTDHWRGTAPINNIDGIWPTGAPWLCWHLWEHYLFTGDKDFLAKHAYPAMKEASLFFIDTLVKDPRTGVLVTNPSFSPEQGGMCAGPAMDEQLIRALFDSTIEAARIVGSSDDELISQLSEKRKQLAPDKVGQHGQLQEWQEDVDQPDNAHRHMSPLWGLFPGDQFTPANEKIYDAAKVLLKWRGDGSTGWSYAWRIPLWARVGDGEFAYRQLSQQLQKKTLPNLFDLCGPFQIDGNFGAPAGIAEMLLQSHIRPTDDRKLFAIDLLPALPKAWPTGSVTGLCARGGFEVDMTWKDGALEKATIRSQLGNPCQIRHAGKSVDLKTEAGKTYSFNSDLK
jgi:alpha-L-fucosidase 2